MRGKALRYLSIYVFPFVITIAGAATLQALTRKLESDLLRTTVYAALTLVIALGISTLIRRSLVALGLKPFAWGKPSSLLWGLLIGLAISAVSGIGFGISQGYSLQWENIFSDLPVRTLRHASPALSEEIVFRAGIVHSTFLLYGKIAGLASGSIPFGILHVVSFFFGNPVTVAQVLGISLAGLMLSLMYLRFGIFGAFATHLIWNALVRGWIGVYGVTDKSAAVSALEGSWVTCLVLVAVSVALFVSTNRFSN